MLEKQIAIIGKSKVGKTRGILFPLVEEKMKEGKSFLFLDSKEEYYPRFAKKLKEEGYQVKVCNFKDLNASDGWDPLIYPYSLYQKGKIDEAIEMIKDLGENLFHSDYPADPFWSSSASNFFTGLVLLLFRLGKKEEVHFASLANFLYSKDHDFLKDYIKTLDSMDPIYIATSSTLFAPVETKESILAVIKDALNCYFLRPTLLQSFQNETIHLDQLENKKTALFLISYSPLDRLTISFLSQAYQAVERDDLDYAFFFDNLSDVRSIPHIEEMIYTASYKKLQLYFASKTDPIKGKYPPHIFENLEKVIYVEKEMEIKEQKDEYPYPTLLEEPLHIFDFQQYFEKNK